MDLVNIPKDGRLEACVLSYLAHAWTFSTFYFHIQNIVMHLGGLTCQPCLHFIVGLVFQAMIYS